MIFLTKGQALLENPNMVVCSPTGYYNDGDSVICAPGFAPDEPACRYEAQFIAYGGVVYSITDPDQLMEEIMKIDPKTLFGKDSQQVAVDKVVEQIVPQDPNATDATATTTPMVTPVETPIATTTPIVTPPATTTPITSTSTPIIDTSTTTPLTGNDTSTTTPITGTSTPPITGTSTPPITGTSTPPGGGGIITGTSTPPGTGGDNGTSTPPGTGGDNGTSTPPGTGGNGNGTTTPPSGDTSTTTNAFLNAVNTILNPNPVSTTTPINRVIDIITSTTTE